MPGPLRFEFGFGKPDPGQRPVERKPFKVLVLGDFTGRESRGLEDAADLGTRKPVRVDVDGFETRLEQMGPTLRLPLTPDPSGPHTEVRFSELDQFHPDTLFRRLDVFRALRDHRARLRDNATFAEAAAELGFVSTAAPTEKPAGSESDADTIGRLLGTEASPTAPATGDALRALVSRVVGPHVVPSADPRQAECLTAMDTAIAAEMRALLHDPHFQGLEALWRATFRLVTTLGTDEEEVQFDLLDVTKSELQVDLAEHAADLTRSGIHRRLEPSGSGSAGWSLIVGHGGFGPSVTDLASLAALAAIAARNGATLLAGATPAVAGAASVDGLVEPRDWQRHDELEASWTVLRGSPGAKSLMLGLPRMLVRLPYGERSDPIDTFDFEEMPAAVEHERYLWGNPALGMAEIFLRRRVYGESGATDLESMPVHTFTRDGEVQMMPCAEVFLSDRAIGKLEELGVTPLGSYRNSDRVAVRPRTVAG